jgi:cytochrome c
MTKWAILLPAMLAATSARAGDVAAGARIFARCRICHTVAAGAPNTVGPNLHGLFGRRAGSLGDFGYSPAMKQSGIVWNDATLAKFLRDPKAFVPGNKMAFPGIDDAGAIDSLLAYLRKATG